MKARAVVYVPPVPEAPLLRRACARYCGQQRHQLTSVTDTLAGVFAVLAEDLADVVVVARRKDRQELEQRLPRIEVTARRRGA